MDRVKHTIMETFFYPNACYVCQLYGKEVELNRCPGCKMIAYCCEQHRKIHWPQHEELCQVINDIMKNNGTLYERYTNMKDKNVWFESRMKLIILVQRKLSRELMHHEMEMLHSPRCCVTCHETDPEKLNDCLNCPYVSFCKKHPKIDSKHRADCETLKLCFESNHVYIGFGNDFVSEKYGKKIPKTMDQAICLYKPSYTFEKIFRPEKIWSLIVADQISRVYTFLWSLKKLLRPKMEEMTIHVVGSNYIEIFTAYYWQRVIHHIKRLQKLDIVFIGPELENNSEKIKCCRDCVINHRRLNIQYVGDFYANFTTSQSFAKPDYVIGFNLGIHACPPENDTWAPSLKVLAQLDCPFFLTSFSASESKLDQERMNVIFGKKVKIFWTGRNPFSGWKPFWNFIDEEIFYQNQYLTIYETLV
ncbi:uncharacterized protein [Venturia canescens]|uniref:uncharacterized protein n=1 Tax=Venturia canescens TaxID=32260 RepID=UPI001C9C6B4C|nr:uncharacterized protein LOC122408422 [Venturia canescens]